MQRCPACPNVCTYCQRPIRCKGLCVVHYSRYRRGSSLEKVEKQVCKGKSCTSCSNPAFSKGLCKFHYQRKRLGIAFDAPVQQRELHPKLFICSVRTCSNPRLAKGLCSLHWQRLRFNIPFDLPYRAKPSLRSTVVRVRNPYRMVYSGGNEYFEHRLIAAENLGRELKPNEVVHHIDEDKTNNSPENLQVMTKSEHIKLHNQLRRFRRAILKMPQVPEYKQMCAA